MKRKLKLTAIAVVAVICGCSTDTEQPTQQMPNHEWFVVIPSEGLPKDGLMEVGREFQNLIGKRAAPDDVVTLIRAPSHETVCSFRVPQGDAKLRLRDPAVKSILPDIRHVFAPETVNTAVVPRVRLPDLAAAISAGKKTSFSTRVVIFGSPLYSEPRYSDQNMRDGRFPSDGMLTEEYSPFNLDGRYPNGTLISWCVLQSQWGLHSQYEDEVTRFNRLLLQRQNATLVRVSSDVGMAFVFENPQFTDTVELRDEPAVMKTFNVVAKPAVQQTASRSNESADAEAVLSAAEQDIGTIALAIEWTSQDGDCDLDLWTESAGHREKMCYSHKKTAFGELYRDVLHSSHSISNPDADYRSMEWQTINHNRLEDLTVWINVYRSSQPAVVRVILVYNGERKDKTIEILPSVAWNKLDLRAF
ncbi:MAG: hypothetical protein R3C19_25590 [Planctomycetaceae bacterium]